MGNIYDDRKLKVERILEEYDKRKTQNEVAEMFGMDSTHVSWVTQENNYKHTRKITQENIKENEKIKPAIFYDDFEFLDKYPTSNFEHDDKVEK